VCQELVAETQFVERAGCARDAVFAHYVECAPKGVGLEGHYYFYSGTAPDVGYQVEIAA